MRVALSRTMRKPTQLVDNSALLDAASAIEGGQRVRYDRDVGRKKANLATRVSAADKVQRHGRGITVAVPPVLDPGYGGQRD